MTTKESGAGNILPGPRKNGLAGIWAALFFSLAGLRAAVRHEAAFRQEVLLFVVLFPLLLLLPVTLTMKLLLLAGNTLVLLAELINSAIEAIVDLVSPDYHLLAKRAKDLGSATVFLALSLAAVLWLVALIDSFVPK